MRVLLGWPGRVNRAPVGSGRSCKRDRSTFDNCRYMGAWSARTLDGDDGGVAGRRRRGGRRSGRHERRAGRRSSRRERGADRRVRRPRRADLAPALRRGREPTRRLPCPARRASCAPRSSPPPSSVLSGASVWASPAPGELLLTGPVETVRAGATVLATGAYDRPIAFPGWTLPGVMTAGGAQALAKGQGVVPGRRVLLAGAGPVPAPGGRAAGGERRRGRRRRGGHAPPRLGARRSADGRAPRPAARLRPLPHEGAPDRVGPRARARRGRRPRRVRDDRALRPGLGAERRRAHLRGRRRLHRLWLPAVAWTSPARSAASCAATPSPTTTTWPRPSRASTWPVRRAASAAPTSPSSRASSRAGWPPPTPARAPTATATGPPRPPDLPARAPAREARGLRRHPRRPLRPAPRPAHARPAGHDPVPLRGRDRAARWTPPSPAAPPRCPR